MADDESGPVVSGWLLGEGLKAARMAASHSVEAVAREFGMHQQTLRRWENAEIIPGVLPLRGLLDHYELSKEERVDLERLRESAAQPRWWNESGKWPDATSELLGSEKAAVRIRSWDLTAIPGLLQTPQYTRSIIQAVEPNISPTQLDADVELRMQRQTKVFGPTTPLREATFMIDEFAFRRMPGGPAARRAQLARLLTPPEELTIQVVPFSAGPHPALGTFYIFDFDSPRIKSAVYVEGSVTAKAMVQKGATPYEQVWEWLRAKALTPQETAAFLSGLLKGITDE